MRRLTQFELAFAVVLVGGVAELGLWLGLVWSAGQLILVGGGVLGMGLDLSVAPMLVMLLTGVFVQHPTRRSSLDYVGLLSVATGAATAVGGCRR